MNQKHANSNSTNVSSLPRVSPEGRCHHRFINGTRCRLLVPKPESLFCRTHAHLPEHEHAPVDLSATLTAGLTEFKSAVPINDFLSRLLLLEAEDRISPRRAAVMAYTCNLILRTLPAIDRELRPDDQDGPDIIIDLPRPRRDDPVPLLQATPSWIGSPPAPASQIPRSPYESY
ncbi:MAG: hypothetical protein WBB89_08200 [Candidatus Acidiferrum sp.]